MKKKVWLLTVNVNFQGLKADVLPIYLHLTQFNYLFTNYFITVVFNSIYYIYYLHYKKMVLFESLKDMFEGQNDMCIILFFVRF